MEPKRMVGQWWAGPQPNQNCIPCPLVKPNIMLASWKVDFGVTLNRYHFSTFYYSILRTESQTSLVVATRTQDSILKTSVIILACLARRKRHILGVNHLAGWPRKEKRERTVHRAAGLTLFQGLFLLFLFSWQQQLSTSGKAETRGVRASAGPAATALPNSPCSVRLGLCLPLIWKLIWAKWALLNRRSLWCNIGNLEALEQIQQMNILLYNREGWNVLVFWGSLELLGFWWTIWNPEKQECWGDFYFNCVLYCLYYLGVCHRHPSYTHPMHPHPHPAPPPTPRESD